eukprot:1139442-Pelagomonas_calceolata.AAC.5
MSWSSFQLNEPDDQVCSYFSGHQNLRWNLWDLWPLGSMVSTSTIMQCHVTLANYQPTTLRNKYRKRYTKDKTG